MELDFTVGNFGSWKSRGDYPKADVAHKIARHIGTTVEAAEADNCEPTCRAYDHEDGDIEWAGVATVDYDGLTEAQRYHLPVDGYRLRAIYYTDAADAERVEDNGGDWGGITWTVHHFELD